jgi:hypothetical protein
VQERVLECAEETTADAESLMYIGEILWETFYLAIVIFGALGLFWLRSANGKTQPKLWIRFSVLAFGICLIGLIEGSLLSPYGFGWFLTTLTLTLYVVAKIAPKLLGGEKERS